MWFLLLFGSIVAIFATRYLLDVNFPEDRTAMYLYPCLILSLGLLINQLAQKLKVIKYLLAVFLAYVPLYFIWNIDASKALFSMDQRTPKEFYEYILAYSNSQGKKATVGGYLTMELCYYFENYRTNGDQNSLLHSSYPDTICDFQITNKNFDPKEVYKDNYIKINQEPINNLDLYIRKTFKKAVFITKSTGVTNWTHQTQEFFNVLEFEVDSTLAGKSLKVNFEGTIHAPNKPFEAILTVSQKDKNYEEISQERVVLNWLRYDWSNDKHVFSTSMLLPKVATNAKHVQVFIWNIKEKPYLVIDANTIVYKLE
jgi:hypothetical protein